MKNLSLVGFLWLILIFSACDDIDVDNPSSSLIAYTFDERSTNRRAVGVLNVLEEQGDTVVLEILENVPGERNLLVAVLAPDTESLVGTYTLDNDGILALIVGTNSENAQELASDSCANPQGQIIITEQDFVNRTVSGTFEGSVCNLTGNASSITEGSFTEVKYVVQVQPD